MEQGNVQQTQGATLSIVIKSTEDRIRFEATVETVRIFLISTNSTWDDPASNHIGTRDIWRHIVFMPERMLWAYISELPAGFWDEYRQKAKTPEEFHDAMWGLYYEDQARWKLWEKIGVDAENTESPSQHKPQ